MKEIIISRKLKLGFVILATLFVTTIKAQDFKNVSPTIQTIDCSSVNVIFTNDDFQEASVVLEKEIAPEVFGRYLTNKTIQANSSVFSSLLEGRYRARVLLNVTSDEPMHPVIIDNITSPIVTLLCDDKLNNASLESRSTRQTNFKIYPNPTGKLLNIQFDGKEDPGYFKVMLRSIVGELMLTHYNSTAIDVEHLPTGVYLLNIEDVNGNQIGESEKLLIQK